MQTHRTLEAARTAAKALPDIHCIVENSSETIYRRVQDQAVSTWKTLRYDVIGEGVIVGTVYHAVGSGGGSSMDWTIVRMPDGSHLPCNRIHRDVGLDGTDKLNVSNYCAPPIDAALQCIRTGKKVKTGRDSWIQTMERWTAQRGDRRNR